MRVEQYVMAYGVEHDRLRAALPQGFSSLRPVVRINGEIRDEKTGYLEVNTPVEKDGIRGWLNVAFWEDISFHREGKLVTFQNDLLMISFKGIGLEGGCPAEKDNAGCFFLGAQMRFVPAEMITVKKEFCDCSFQWRLPKGAFGKSIGKTLPAYPEEIQRVYPQTAFTAENIAVIPCKQVLGTYQVIFER